MAFQSAPALDNGGRIGPPGLAPIATGASRAAVGLLRPRDADLDVLIADG